MHTTENNAPAASSGQDAARARRQPFRSELALPVALLMIVLACLASPIVHPIPLPVGASVLDANQALFSPGHFLGTDMNGNDVWSRLVYGGRASLLIAISVNAIGLLLGGSLGALCAHWSGVADSVVMRVLDALIAFPPLILVLAVAEALGPGRIYVILALAFFSVPAFARIARAATLRLREQPFMTAAVLAGVGTWRTLARHVAPNILPQLATFALLGIGAVINIEGAVSFLGLGVPLPQPSWGNMIYQGQMALAVTPELVLLPSAFLVVTVLSFNLLGDALRGRRSRR